MIEFLPIMKIKFTEFSLDLIYPESPPRFYPVNIHNNSPFRSLKRSTHAEHRTCVLDSPYSGALTSSSTKPKGGHSCQKHPCTLFNHCFLLFPSAPPSWRARFIKTHLHKSNWHARTHTHRLLDIEGASRHSVVPVPQLVVLGANHQLSGGLVFSDTAG